MFQTTNQDGDQNGHLVGHFVIHDASTNPNHDKSGFDHYMSGRNVMYQDGWCHEEAQLKNAKHVYWPVFSEFIA